MCPKASVRPLAVALGVLACALGLSAQSTTPDWRHIGTSALDLGLAGLATGPVDRVWFSEDGSQLFAKAHSGRTFQTADFEQWHAVQAVPPLVEDNVAGAPKPETTARIKLVAGTSRLYAVGAAVYRSDDGGSTWSNLSQSRGTSLLGTGLTDLAVSPRNPDELVAASATGVWRSVDAGLSWTGLNQFLPNLTINRIYELPSGWRGVRASVSSPEALEIEWAPGEKTAWQVSDRSDIARDESVKTALSRAFGVTITSITGFGSYMYAGSSDGQIWSSADKGETWSTPSDRLAGPVEALYVNPKDGRIALAAVGSRNPAAAPSAKLPHVLRTMNGGIFWDDVTSNLPDSPAHGVTADPSSGAVYVATDAGVFLTITDLSAAGRATTWTPVRGNLPALPASDVKLDAGGNQLFVAVDGQGIYTTIAPHRTRDVRLVNAADYSSRAAAPGGLLTVIGTRVQAAEASELPVPVLDATEIASQIQVPFDAKGSAVSVALNAGTGKIVVGLPLQTVSPAIFVNPDGSPWIMDADTGVLLDSSKPALANSHIQILATGLGRVTPDWPAGVAAPLSDPPRVQANVKVYADRIPLQVVQATLAPGYIGSYLIEAQIPAVVNNGPTELYVEADGQSSNRVRIYLQR